MNIEIIGYCDMFHKLTLIFVLLFINLHFLFIYSNIQNIFKPTIHFSIYFRLNYYLRLHISVWKLVHFGPCQPELMSKERKNNSKYLIQYIITG